MSAAQRLLCKALPTRIQTAASNWRVARNDLSGAISCIEDRVAAAFRGDRQTPDVLASRVSCLHNSRCRTVLRSPLRCDGPATCVIKIVYLPGLKRKLRSWRYGLAEGMNLIRAHDLDIRVPRVYGVGTVFRRWRIPVATAVVMEDLGGHCAAGGLLQSAHDDIAAATAIVDNALPIFARLYHAGCNHIDTHSHNIMLPSECFHDEPALIDFEYVAFGTVRNPGALALQAGKFARSCLRIVPELDMETWLLQLLDDVAIHAPALRRSVVERFRFCCEHKLSITERLHPEVLAA